MFLGTDRTIPGDGCWGIWPGCRGSRLFDWTHSGATFQLPHGLVICSSSLILSCYRRYIAVSSDLVRRYNALTVITWIFIVGSVVTIPPALVSLSRTELSHISLNASPLKWLCHHPAADCHHHHYLNAWALSRVPPSTVAACVYLQPLIAFVVAPIVLGESPWRSRADFVATNYLQEYSQSRESRRRQGHR